MKIARLIVALGLIIVLLGFSAPAYAHTDPQTGPATTPSTSSSGAASKSSNYSLFKNVCTTGGSSSALCQDAANRGTTNPVAGPGGIIPEVTDILAIVGGIAAIIMIIVSGLTMATSAGNSEHVASARKRLTWAVVGLLIIGVAWSIVNFVIDRLIA